MPEWTVMVYMAGDNDLDSNGIEDLFEMKRVGSSDEVKIIAQFDRSGQIRHTKRYLIRDFDQAPRLSNDVVKDLGETNSGDRQVFVDFLNWGLEFGAKKNLVIIWGHGTGTDDTNIFVSDGILSMPPSRRRGIFRPRPTPPAQPLAEALSLATSNDRIMVGLSESTLELIATDDEAEDFLDNVELKQAFNSLERPIDIVGMDACLMSMAEICYQFRENVGITIASQAQTDKEGWPYERILRKLVANPGMTAETLSKLIVREFVAFYEEHDEVSAALAACRLEFAPPLAGRVDRLAEALIDGLSNTAILNAIIASRRLVWADEVIETVDLKDFCALLRRKCDNDAIDSACTSIINFINDNDKIMIDFHKHGDGVRFATGLGIYFPQDEVSSLYGRLDFVSNGNQNGDASAPKWANFISKYIEATTRTE